MKAEDKLQIWKFLLLLFNSLFVILGISFFGCSMWILFDKNNIITVLSNETDVKVLAGGLFVIGLIVLLVSLLGCCGIYLENRCFIAFYMGFLIATFLGQLFITFFLLFKRTHIESLFTKHVDNTIETYGVNTTESTRRLLDSVQQSAQCCGRKSASDWKTNTLIQLHNISDIYPCSCVNGTCDIFLANKMYQFGNGSHMYTEGCEEKLLNWLEKNIIGIVGMDIGLLLIEIVQFVLTIQIFRSIGFKIKEKKNNLLNANEENVVSESDIHQLTVEDYQPDMYSHDHSNPEYTGLNHPDQQTYNEPNNAVYDQGRVNAYGQEEDGLNNDQYRLQHWHGPEHNSQIYNQVSEQEYGQQYVTQHQDQHYLHEHDQDYSRPYSGHYNQGYVQN